MLLHLSIRMYQKNFVRKGWKHVESSLKKLQRQLNLLEILFEGNVAVLGNWKKDWQVLEKHYGTIL